MSKKDKPIYKQIRKTWNINPQTQIVQNKQEQTVICDFCDYSDSPMCENCLMKRMIKDA